jgi:hypothetical protein
MKLQDLYVDYESGSEPMNFFHVFLYSQALECVVLSMVGWTGYYAIQLRQCVVSAMPCSLQFLCGSQIMDAPTEEEISLLSEIFGQVLQPLDD